MRKRLFTLIFLFSMSFGLVTCSSNNEPQNLKVNSEPQKERVFRIWWSQGFLPEENELVAKLISQWEKESGKKAELRLISQANINGETQKALKDGNPPDLLYSQTGETLIPTWAWENQLADVSDLINPIKDLYDPKALESVYFGNKISKKRSYYSVPIGKQRTHLFYWRNLLQEAGLTEEEIPTKWNEFWEFWKKAQDILRQNGKSNIYGLGLTMSDFANDTVDCFENFLDAYNVKIVDKEGNLLLKNPANREGIIKALKQFTSFYKDGYVPPNSVEWSDSGNNVSFLESQSLMTSNGTLSIPLTQKLEQNQYNKLSTDLYFNKIVTAGWPEKIGGGELTSILIVKQIVIFEASQHKEEAKSFISYLLKPENLNQFLKNGAKGRVIPVMSKFLQDPFWSDPKDPHMPVAVKEFNRLTRPGYEVFNPAYSQVLAQHIWGKTVVSVIKDGVSPEKAADEAIAKIEEIFAQWE